MSIVHIRPTCIEYFNILEKTWPSTWNYAILSIISFQYANEHQRKKKTVFKLYAHVILVIVRAKRMKNTLQINFLFAIKKISKSSWKKSYLTMKTRVCFTPSVKWEGTARNGRNIELKIRTSGYIYDLINKTTLL